MDKSAWEADDGVMLCSRVKWHTGFEGRIESGIHKMMAIGLGKWEGARRYQHVGGPSGTGAGSSARSGRVMLDTGRMLGGLAILEDACHGTAEVHAVGASSMVPREEALLARVKGWKANIPVSLDRPADRGRDRKEHLGLGHGHQGDQSLLSRAQLLARPPAHRAHLRPQHHAPRRWQRRGGSASATSSTTGSTRRSTFPKTWINSFTASSTIGCMCPPHFPTDRECIEKILATCGKADSADCGVVWIRNTMELGRMRLSENLLEGLRG